MLGILIKVVLYRCKRKKIAVKIKCFYPHDIKILIMIYLIFNVFYYFK